MFQKKNVDVQKEDVFDPWSHSGRTTGPVFVALTAQGVLGDLPLWARAVALGSAR